jgi:hypothetical protein
MNLLPKLSLPVNAGCPFLLCLSGDCGIAGKAEPCFLYQFLNIVHMGAGRAMIIIPAHTACQFNKYFMGFDLIRLLGLSFKQDQFAVNSPAAAATAGKRQFPDVVCKIEILKTPCLFYKGPVTIISWAPLMNYMTLDDGYQFYHANLFL